MNVILKTEDLPVMDIACGAHLATPAGSKDSAAVRVGEALMVPDVKIIHRIEFANTFHEVITLFPDAPVTLVPATYYKETHIEPREWEACIYEVLSLEEHVVQSGLLIFDFSDRAADHHLVQMTEELLSAADHLWANAELYVNIN